MQWLMQSLQPLQDAYFVAHSNYAMLQKVFPYADKIMQASPRVYHGLCHLYLQHETVSCTTFSLPVFFKNSFQQKPLVSWLAASPPTLATQTHTAEKTLSTR